MPHLQRALQRGQALRRRRRRIAASVRVDLRSRRRRSSCRPACRATARATGAFAPGASSSAAVGLRRQLVLQQRLDPGLGAGVAGEQEAFEPRVARRRAPAARCGAGRAARRRSAAPRRRPGRAALRCCASSVVGRRFVARRRGTARRALAAASQRRGRTARRSRRESAPSARAAARARASAASSGSQATAEQRPRQFGLEDLHRRVLELGLLRARGRSAGVVSALTPASALAGARAAAQVLVAPVHRDEGLAQADLVAGLHRQHDASRAAR